jgi:ribosomal protein L13
MRNPNVTTLYSLSAIYIALTEAIAATFGRDVEPLANRLIKDMLPQMEPDAAEMCRRLIDFAGSGDQQESTRAIAGDEHLTMH